MIFGNKKIWEEKLMYFCGSITNVTEKKVNSGSC